MRILDILRLRLRSITRREVADRELDREFQFHLDRQIEEFVAAGMPPKEARYKARRVIGAPTQLQEECRDMRSVAWFENSMQDLKYATRALAKTPGFTFIAVLSLALGIGANTAIFSVVQAVLVRDLPYPNSDRIVHLTHPSGGIDAGSMLEYAFLKEHATSFSSVAATHGSDDQALTVNGNAFGIRITNVSADFFRTLGVPPAIGREFNAEETRPGGARAIVLTDALWRNALSSDPSVVGRNIMVSGTAFSVAGVLPPNFWLSTGADAFVPLRPSGASGDEGFNNDLIARLKPGVAVQQANAELAALGGSLRRMHGSALFDDYKGMSTILYRQWLTGDVRTNLLLLFGAVLLLLIIACTNLASLLFARLASRQREIAVRLALGSSPGRLMRLFVIENFLIVAMGCAAGIAAAAWSIDALVHLFPYALPASAPIGLNWQVLGFTFSIAIGTALAFSIAPVAMSSRVKLDQALRAGRSQSSGVRQRVRALMVITEVALSTAMLVAAALLIATLYREQQERLGFDPKGVITFWTPSTHARAANAEELRNFETSVLDRMRVIPGVRNVASSNVLPLTRPNNYPTQRQGHPDQAFGGMEIRVVSPSYFETMGIPILRGRALDATDVANSMPVIMVNETVAKQWWPDGDFAGSRVEIGRYRGKIYGDGDPARTVIGVVADTKSVQLKRAPRPTVYLPAAQTLIGGSDVAWIVRGNVTPSLMQQIRQAIANIDPSQSITEVRTMEEIVAATMSDSRFDAWLYGMFAALALMLTMIGVYGLVAFFVAQRTNEIGIRLALGASRGGVVAMVLKQGVGLIVAGLALGLAGAVFLTRSFEKLLYGVKFNDPRAFIAVAVVLLIVGAVASLIPARQASKVDPMVALRYE